MSAKPIHSLVVLLLVAAGSACADPPEDSGDTARPASAKVEVLLLADVPTSPTTTVRRPEFEPGSFADERREMVRSQIAARGIEDEAVLTAMRRVPRHVLVPAGNEDEAYDDRPLPIGHGQTISQPYIVAYMTELLELAPDDRVLEVGTGSGYQAAVLAEIVRQVVTIEIIDDLARNAANHLDDFGYENITVLSGDGYFGWEKEAPYDAIVVTAAAEHIPPPLVAQLKPGGRMAIPVGRTGWTQNLYLVEKGEDGKIVTRNMLAVRFVPLTRERR